MYRSKKTETIFRISLLLIVITIICVSCNTTNQSISLQAAGTSEEETSQTLPETSADSGTQTQETTEAETTIEETLPALKKGYRYAWVTAYGTLNVRKKPSKKSKVVGLVSHYDCVIVKGKKTKKGYYKITGTDSNTKEEIKGYCSGKYLTFKQQIIKPVQLNIPLYLQTDERWAKVTLGNSGRTIESIGCTTTCMAMCETYIRGKTVTPDLMEKELYYTSRGELGWPDSYTASYDESTYLQIVYNKLSNNIPVLIGCQKTNGRPHWVLITGYTGEGKTFKAKDFVINDPLTKKRTNLAQYLKKYSKFMKIVYSNGKDSSKYKKTTKETTKNTSSKKSKSTKNKNS